MTYNISSRLYAGLALEASSWREGRVEKVAFGSDDGGLTFGAGVVSREIVKVRVPGYVDLGVNCGYRFNRKLEFWLESGNLLCQAIQRNPFYAEKGLWASPGVRLSL